MKVGPFRIRTGVIDHEKTSIAWVNELQRSTIMTSRAASCSFYVPIMTPIVVALTQDRIETEGQEEVNASANLNKRILVTIIAGSVEYNEIIRRNESTFRLYGSNISTTGFMGSEFSLVACEEIVEITISDLATEKLLASFEYKHLLSDSLPQGMDVNAIDFDGSSMPFITMPADGNNTTEAPPSLNTSPLVNVSQAVEEEELVDWDGDVVVEDVSVNTTPKKAATGERTLVLLPPSTPKQSTSQSASTSPDIDRPRGLFAHSFQSRFKPIIRRPEPKLKIKTETPGEEGQARSSSNGKTVSPPHVIRKDTLARVDEIESQIKDLEAATEELGVIYQKKMEKARAACLRAEQRAEDECNLNRMKNIEAIEKLQKQLNNELTTLQWVQEKIRAEVITISDDESDAPEDDIDMGVVTKNNISEHRSFSTT